ncbi:MAG TPA: PAS domain S-box protein [Natrialbaceae archaeon]|nr:PAS domain S-box protein [Natrialbaceae archaeon]
MTAGDGDSITILHVDDDPDFTDLTAEFLEREDDRFEVRSETRSETVLDRLESRDVDCVVSDYQMPGMDGLELLEAVREDRPDLPFVLFTGAGSESVAGEAISAGVTDYIQKTSGTGQYELLAKRIREAVSHSRARLSYEEVFEKSGFGMTIHDVDTYELVAANRRYFDLLGCEDEERLDLSLVDLTADVEGYTPTRAREHLDTAAESGSHTFEWPLVTRDGEQIWVEITAERAEIGGQERLLGTVRDVTERKEQERQLSTLISNLPGIMYRCENEEGWPMDIVRGDADELVGYPAERIESGSISWGADVVHPEDRETVWKGVQSALQNDEPFTLTYRVRTADGGTRWVWEQGRAVRSAAGEVEGLEGFITDVTERKERERELETEREWNEALIEGARDAIFISDRDANLVEANEAATELTGYDREALRSMRIPDLHEAEDLDAYEEYHDRILEGEAVTTEAKLLRPDGTKVDVEFSNRAIEVDGEPYMHTVARDVTDRREHRRELERYKLAIESSFDLVAAIDTDHDFLFANDAYCRYHDCEATDLPGKGVADVLGQGVYEDVRPRIETALEGDPVRYEMSRDHPDGGERHLDIRYASIEDEDGTVRGAIGTMRDVTDRKKRERALAALHDAATDLETADCEDEVYDTLVDAAEGILDFDLVAVDVEENGALVQRAWTLELDTEGYYEETSLEEDTFATRAFNRQETISVDDLREYEITPADPEYRSALTVPIAEMGTFQAVSREAGAFDEADRELAELLVGHAREALQRVDHERSLREQRKRLRHENERLEEFASVVSHDLRNPLTVAGGELAAAREECESPHLDEIATSLDRMETIVEDVLAMARNGSIVEEADLETVDLATLVERCWRTVETTDASLRVETTVTLPADGDRVRRAVENLFRNSVEHGGDDVTITVGDLDGTGFYVADDGPGIPPTEREDVFDPGHTSRDSGTGFGLAIVEEIVQAHGWSISVTESEGGGARFEVTGVDNQ